MSEGKINPVEKMYDSNSEGEWDRLAQHRTEFAVTMRALADYLPITPASIFDVGGGPGRYTIALAKLGYEVTLLDLSQSNLNLAAEKAAVADVKVKAYLHGNALDLAAFEDELFDAVLMFGPLYHLLSKEERLLAVQEGLRVLKPNGRLFAAFINRFAAFRSSAVKDPNWLITNRAYAEHLLATGIHDQGNVFVNAYFAHPLEIKPFMESAGLHTLNLIGCEGVVSLVEEKINQLEGAEFDLWVDFNYRMGQDRSLHGAAEHLLYIGEKV